MGGVPQQQFPLAVLLAANLGQDADTTAAIAGQLAGAVYGASAIPADWLAALAWRERIEDTAGQLFEAGWLASDQAETDQDRTPDNGFPAPWAARAWTMQERLQALVDSGKAALNDAALPGSEGAGRFHKAAYDYGWVRAFDWSAWRQAERGSRLMSEPGAMATADADDLRGY